MHHLCRLGVVQKFLNCGPAAEPKQDLVAQFTEHIGEFGLSYGTEAEFKFRLGLYEQKNKEIEQINADPENTFTVGHNKFSTWTKDEQLKLMGLKLDAKAKEATVLPVTGKQGVDWR
jgi:hypothetical protein